MSFPYIKMDNVANIDYNNILNHKSKKNGEKYEKLYLCS